MKYKTKIGEVEIIETDIVLFEKGIPGFEHLKKFAIFSVEDTAPIQWLLSVEDSNTALPVLDPWLVRKDYFFDVPKETINLLDIKNRERLLTCCIVRIPSDDSEEITVNLTAPIIINLDNSKGTQLILDIPEYDLRHSLIKEIERSKKLVQSKNSREESKNAGSEQKK